MLGLGGNRMLVTTTESRLERIRGSLSANLERLRIVAEAVACDLRELDRVGGGEGRCCNAHALTLAAHVYELEDVFGDA